MYGKFLDHFSNRCEIWRLGGLLEHENNKPPAFLESELFFFPLKQVWKNQACCVSILVARFPMDSEENSVENLYNYKSGLILRKFDLIQSITV